MLRHFGLRPAGGNHRQLRRWLDQWGISTEHFVGTPPPRRREPNPLEAILVEGSTYQRVQLKQRLYSDRARSTGCELCGHGEEWRGRRMALILDHINGVADDNRLENLRIVCPNCAATLDTHCGRQNRADCAIARALIAAAVPPAARAAAVLLARLWGALGAQPGDQVRAPPRVERPPYEQLVAEVAATGWSAVGRKYGVSDNAVRKWVRAYERERAA